MNVRNATLLIAVAIGYTSAIPAGDARGAADATGQAFRDARGYTVRVRTQITTPFLEDERGAFQGSGFLVNAERGWIVTNAHVVGQSPSEVEVAFAGQPYQPARKLYVDSFADVAVLSIGPVDRHAAQLFCDADPVIGEPVGVFGHPLGIPFTGTRGIVSNITDKFGVDLIQVDATVNAGNSGGPAISMSSGKVIGIATAGAGGDKSGRMNFVTPIRSVCRILELLTRGMNPNPPDLALALLKDEDGHHTMEVAQTLDPEHWPLEPGDRLLGLPGNAPWRGLTALVDALRGRSGGIQMRVERDGKPLSIEVKPQPHPSVVDRNGLLLDGALIAAARLQDEVLFAANLKLVVHSVESASTAEALDVQKYDFIYSIDGRTFDDVASLVTHMRARDRSAPVTIVLRRITEGYGGFFEYQLRELPAEQVEVVGDQRQSAER